MGGAGALQGGTRRDHHQQQQSGKPLKSYDRKSIFLEETSALKSPFYICVMLLYALSKLGSPKGNLQFDSGDGFWTIFRKSG